MNSTNPRKQSISYGSWPSPITAELVAGKSLRLAQPCVEGAAVYWLETRPDDRGRTVLVRWTAQGCEDVTPDPYSVQSKVHEYGGGAYAVHGTRIWFVNRSDQCIHEVNGTQIMRLTEPDECNFADLAYDAARDRLLAVCETSSGDTEPVSRVVAIDCRDGNVTTLAAGADFYSSARLSPEGSRIAWLEWNHPDMPWDATRLYAADLDNNGVPVNLQHVAGSGSESVVQPLWRNEKELLFVSDRTDWWNLYAWTDNVTRELWRRDAEFALPHWVFGMQSWGLRDNETVVCSYSRQGLWQVAEINIDDGVSKELDLPYTQIEHLHAANGRFVLQTASAELATRIVLVDAANNVDEVRIAADHDLNDAFFPAPETVSFDTTGGEQAHALYYAPAHATVTGETGTAPPLLVKAHGGPTAATSSALDLKIRYWTSRGFAVLDVNYRGSTGYGRQYRHRLYGNWGVVDVEDCIHGAREIASRGLADPERLLITGSSAGGYTVLCALVFHDVFAAGASYYGVADPAGAMRDTAKFESRYGDKLIGPLPATEALWRKRSPLFNAEKLRRPVIFFQGLEDFIVPPDQSERMYEAARANDVKTEYLKFPTEGHGFRQAATIETALQAEYDFYCDVLGIVPAATRSTGSEGVAS